MTYLNIDEVKKRLNRLSSYELDSNKYFDIVDEEMNRTLPNKERLAHVYKNLLEQVSEEINSIDKHINLTPSCRLGCAFCCYFPIIITRLVANMIIYSIETMNEKRRHEVINHLQNYFANNEELYNDATPINLYSEDVKLAYIQKQLPCPMLDTETNRCIAYEVRPLPCRTYVNYTDPAVCEENFMPEEAVSYEFLYEEYMGALNEAAQIVYESDDASFLNYPTDIYEVNYLPVFLKEWIDNKSSP